MQLNYSTPSNTPTLETSHNPGVLSGAPVASGYQDRREQVTATDTLTISCPDTSSQQSHEKVRRSRRKRDELIKLKDIAGEILGYKTDQDGNVMRDEDGNPIHNPVFYCGHLVTDPQGVNIRYSLEREQAYIEHVRSCNQVHTCPVCSKRQAEEWKERILKICQIANHKEYSTLMLTVTAQHTLPSGKKLEELLLDHTPQDILEEQLRGTLNAVIEAYRYVFSGDRTTGTRAPLARVRHQVKKLEVRFSANGFHTHLHSLPITDERDLPEEERGPFEDRLGELIYSRYKSKLNQLGYEIAPQGYYCQAVRTWGAAARYIQKLETGLEASLELTQSESKQSEKSYSMFQLLALYERGQRRVFGWNISDIFKAYASGIRGRRAFTLSENIEELLGMTLEQLREQEEWERKEKLSKQRENDPKLAKVDPQLWWYIVSHKLVITLLSMADSNNAEQVEAWLGSARQTMEVSRRSGNSPPEPEPPPPLPDEFYAWQEYTE